MADKNIQRDKDIIKTPPLVLEPIFELPADLDEGTYVQRESGFTSGDLTEPGQSGTPSAPDAPLTDPEVPGTDRPTWEHPNVPYVPKLDPRPLGAPFEINVKSQTFRFSSDGTYVVDVVLEFPDVDGANSYEVRVAK